MDTASGIVAVVLGGGALASVIAPIVRLNGSIVKLTAEINKLIEDMGRNEQRITKHGQEIENVSKVVDLNTYKICLLEDRTADHEQRIHNLEAK